MNVKGTGFCGTGLLRELFFVGWDGTWIVGTAGQAKTGPCDFCFILLKITIHQKKINGTCPLASLLHPWSRP